MLLQYVVSNFKSICHPITFSMFLMEETKDNRFLKSLSVKTGTWRVLCKGGFFDPNASGKSSFVE